MYTLSSSSPDNYAENPSGLHIQTITLGGGNPVWSDRPWTGVELLIPGDSPRQLLFANTQWGGGIDGSPVYITNDLWKGECVLGDSGMDFKVTSPNGVNYLFETIDSTTVAVNTLSMTQELQCYINDIVDPSYQEITEEDYEMVYKCYEYAQGSNEECIRGESLPVTYTTIFNLYKCGIHYPAVSSYQGGAPQLLRHKTNVTAAPGSKLPFVPRYWNVSRVTDRFENFLDYTYKTLSNGYKVPASIIATENADGSLVSQPAAITFNYIGDQLDTVVAGAHSYSYSYLS